MSIIMDNRLESENIDKDEEVKKLQELVKKLEIQNEELRSERQAFLYGSKECVYPEKLEKENSESETKNVVSNKDSDSSEDSKKLNTCFKLKMTVEDGTNLSDEETWLFDSPKAKHQNDWLRRDINDPSLVEVKKSLVKKLDEITNSPRYSSCHSLYSPSSSSGVLSPESPPSSKGEIDTRTFIRPKKRKPLSLEGAKNAGNGQVKEEMPTTMESQNGSVEYLAHSGGSFGSEEDDRLSSASDGSYSSFRLTDVEDVNALARLQEESLKFPEHGQAERHSGALSKTRGITPSTDMSSFRRAKPYVDSSGNSATSSQEDLLLTFSPEQMQSTPKRSFAKSALPYPRRYPISRLDLSPSRENSDLSSTQESSHLSYQNLDTYNGKAMNSRLPSLTRRLGGSDPRLLDIQKSPSNSRTSSPQPVYSYNKNASNLTPKSVNRTSRLQTSQPRGSRLSAPSPVRIPFGPMQIVDSSPPSKSSEASRPRQSSSALPRPGSRLQTPNSRVSKSPMKLRSQSDWREGCY